MNMLKREKVEDLCKETDIKKNQISTKFIINKIESSVDGCNCTKRTEERISKFEDITVEFN